MYLPTFYLQVSVSADGFSQCYEGLEKVARKLSLLTDKCPLDSLEFELDQDKERRRPPASIIKQLDAVMAHPAPSYESTLFPWWSTTPIPAESSTSWWTWDGAGDTKGLQQFGVTALCCTMTRGTGAFV